MLPDLILSLGQQDYCFCLPHFLHTLIKSGNSMMKLLLYHGKSTLQFDRRQDCSTSACHWHVILQHTLIISSYHKCSTVTYLFCIISCLIQSLNHALDLHAVNSTSHSTKFIILTLTAVSLHLLCILWFYVLLPQYSLSTDCNMLTSLLVHAQISDMCVKKGQ